MAQAWLDLLADVIHTLRVEIRKRQDTQLRIAALRRAELLKTLGGMDRLTQLADYGARIQKHMERTLAMLREIESLAVVIDV